MTRKRVTRAPTANLLNLLHLLRSAIGPEDSPPSPAGGSGLWGTPAALAHRNQPRMTTPQLTILDT